MELLNKVKRTLEASFPGAEVTVWDNDGIFGFAVSELFRNHSSLARQEMIDKAFESPGGLTKSEFRRVMLISPFTPLEFKFASAYKPRKKRIATKRKATKKTPSPAR